MRRLSLVSIFILVLAAGLSGQKSPHGDSFALNCKDCHSTEGWKVELARLTFDHGTTRFPLAGRHKEAGCRDCHTSLEFAAAPVECNECHIDVHEQTTGPDCGRCHTPESWLVPQVTQLHQQSRFPLLGAHTVAECKDCHINLAPGAAGTGTASRLRFDPIGVDCYDCHNENYASATNPNHIQANYSKNCTDCHNINAFSWKGAGINHNFFPLNGGHSLECNRCHTSSSYSDISSECISCHQPEYNSTDSPNHIALNFSTDCKTCHSLNPGWKPAEFRNHDSQYFPIYSGEHEGEWSNCSDCHNNPSDYGQFTCISCHEHTQDKTDDQHDGVAGYTYNSVACFGCHPTGSGEGAFDHNTTNFPLSGGHLSTSCSDCHSGGFSGTPTACSSCHSNNFNQTTNPNHSSIGISTECATCHTTNPGWKPAGFPVHNDYYVLEGAHLSIATDCSSCHAGNYTNTPSNCYGCHEADYNQSLNPSHSAAQFPTTCEDCHNAIAWKPSTFNHDGQHFPIYSGKHNGEWNNCSECHTNTSNYSLYSCIDCHDHNQADMDNEHLGIGGYVYNSVACYQCHPDGNASGSFNHNTSGFPLTGGHLITDCSSCHSNGYSGTSTVCSSCHINNYNQSANPNHTSLGISTDCSICHTINPGWQPATFPVHNNYYVIQGAHLNVANDCATCHQGNYINPPNTCYGCHADAYNQTTSPNHVASQFSTSCEACHSQNAWIPATFDHNSVYPLTGAHAAVTNCTQCHTSGYSNTPNTCQGCHQGNYSQTTNPNHTGIGIPNECVTCHTTNPGWQPATFPIHNNYYVLAGAHATIANQCSDCHNGNYNNTPNTCSGCHMNNYNQTTNPNHSAQQYPTTCEICHTQSAWAPSTFNHDAQYFPIYSGTHNGEWNTCSDCHPNPSNYGDFTCTTSCHPQSSTNNEHQGISGYSYNSAACLACHPNGNADNPSQRILRLN